MYSFRNEEWCKWYSGRLSADIPRALTVAKLNTGCAWDVLSGAVLVPLGLGFIKVRRLPAYFLLPISILVFATHFQVAYLFIGSVEPLRFVTRMNVIVCLTCCCMPGDTGALSCCWLQTMQTFTTLSEPGDLTNTLFVTLLCNTRIMPFRIFLLLPSQMCDVATAVVLLP